MNFLKNPEGATRKINNWVTKQPQKKILDLISEPWAKQTRHFFPQLKRKE